MGNKKAEQIKLAWENSKLKYFRQVVSDVLRDINTEVRGRVELTFNVSNGDLESSYTTESEMKVSGSIISKMWLDFLRAISVKK